jgi:hypothetical protein
MGIGAMIGDAMRRIQGQIDASFVLDSATIDAGGVLSHYTGHAIGAITGSERRTLDTLLFDTYSVVPTALENRPASISAYVCIKY